MCNVESDVRDIDPIQTIRDQASSALSERFLLEIEKDMSKLPSYLHLRTRLLIETQRALRRAAEAAESGDLGKATIARDEYLETLKKLRLEQCTVAEAFIFEFSESHRHYPQDLQMAIAPVIQEVIVPTVARIEERLSLLETAVTMLMSQRGNR